MQIDKQIASNSYKNLVYKFFQSYHTFSVGIKRVF